MEVKDNKQAFEAKVEGLQEQMDQIERDTFSLTLEEKDLEEKLRDMYDEPEEPPLKVT